MFNRTDYCQFILSTQINYTLTYFAEHAGNFSHDLINRYLSNTNRTYARSQKFSHHEILVVPALTMLRTGRLDCEVRYAENWKVVRA